MFRTLPPDLGRSERTARLPRSLLLLPLWPVAASRGGWQVTGVAATRALPVFGGQEGEVGGQHDGADQVLRVRLLQLLARARLLVLLLVR